MMDDIDCESLIAAVEKQPVVWDPSCSDSASKQKKNNAWINICEDVVDNYADIEEVGARKDIGK